MNTLRSYVGEQTPVHCKTQLVSITRHENEDAVSSLHPWIKVKYETLL